MRIVLIIMFLLLVTGASADSFMTARTAIINTTLESSFTTVGVTEQVSADVSFFPKKLQTQGVDYPHVSSNVGVTWEQTNQSSLLVKWNAAPSVDYSITYQVGTFSARPDFPKVPYPLELDESAEQFLQETRFITKEDPKIKALAESMAKNATDSVDLAFTLAEWVKENIEYNLSTLTTDISQPASWVLEQRTGVCDELTVLFLAMSRAVGLPSRYVAGIAYTESNSFEQNWIPHAWAEVFMPGIGWVPFDITYGQLGWTDASHIITKTSGDVDDASITYSWKKGDVTLGPMELGGNLIDKKELGKQPLSMNIRPLIHQVYPGSIVPMEITLNNPSELRLATTIHIESAPGIIGHSDIPMLIDGRTSQDAFIYVKIPEEADVKYDYLTPVKIKEAFGSTASSTLAFGADYGRINMEQAQELVNLAIKSERDSTSKQIFLHCSTSRAFYDMNATGALVCSMLGYPQRIKLCAEGNCEDIAVKKNQIALHQFNILANEEEIIKVEAYAVDGIAVSYVSVNIADEPTLSGEIECPDTIGASEMAPIKLTLSSEKKVEDIVIKTNEGPIKTIDIIKGTEEIKYNADGANLVDRHGLEEVLVVYTGADRATYTFKIQCKIPLKQMTALEVLGNWYRKILRFFGNS